MKRSEQDDVQSMAVLKPKLSLDEQIEYLKKKGVRFNIMNEASAKKYLAYNSNYFKLTAYRKNYSKHPDGADKGKYIHLEFAYLVDLAVIDMKLRYKIVQIALDIEHHTKLQILREADLHNEDGYQIVSDYTNSLNKHQLAFFESEISRNKENVYCGDIIDKYHNTFPVWALLEVIPFGRLVSFYGFCAERFKAAYMQDNYYRLLTCKEIRNAAAHSNCILNELKAHTAKHKTNTDVTKELMKIPGISAGFRKSRMSNARIQQIVTLLYMHKTMVSSAGLRQSETNGLHEVVDRIKKHYEFYEDNPTIKSSLDFLKLVIDNWFPIG
ncbi:MAG: Abi family protein [Lachnospiraceae bacterium]|jgi:abortive infection bacteriophage resistance protein|nr:Abi family protein [Lachnospiraceae bacterium]MCH4063805.1 Abi family protein [Lachnospiraceae bacterium]MCH4103472.1 Abi family protein [Lachnospiraceae bacterium]MCI1310128.1 Abi family protein [Lachnospiraceae bacterium]MCI1334582.1 Abi family protein [Lachnospiraceae bacterium]